MILSELIKKLNEYSNSINVAFENKQVIEGLEDFDSVILCEDFEFRVEKFDNNDGSKPYYKLVISPIKH